MNLFDLLAQEPSSRPEWAGRFESQYYRYFGGLEAWQWLGLLVAAIVAVGGYFAGKAIAMAALKFKDRIAQIKTSRTTMKDFRRAVGIILGALLFRSILVELFLPSWTQRQFYSLTVAAVLIGGVLLAFATWDGICDTLSYRSGNKRAENLLIPITRKLVRGVILIAGMILSLSIFGIDVAGIIAGLGIGGIVVALAAKDSVENIFGSITMLFDMPFAIGDWVRIDRTEGVVEEINLRSTRIRTFEDTVITLPNANLIRAAVENFGARRTRRQRFTVRIGYRTEPDDIAAMIADITRWLNSQDSVAKDKSVVALTELGDASMGILVQALFDAHTLAIEMELRQRLMMYILESARAHRVEMVALPRFELAPPPENPT